MLVSAQFEDVATVQRLIKLWADRYTLNLSPLAIHHNPAVYSSLLEAATPEKRAQTAAKIDEYFVDFNCQLAAVQSRILYEYVPGVVDLREARRLTQHIADVYRKLLLLYQDVAATDAPPINSVEAVMGDSVLSAWGIPDVQYLAQFLEPVLMELQEQHTRSRDWRTLGFITTQFNFGNQLLLARLSPVEQVLVTPYFKFVEEQVALPWQRVCAAAAQHEVDSPAFVLVEQMLPIATDIAKRVYAQLCDKFPDHRSRRGGLDHPGVAHSCIRDLQMFQAYLWLSLLQGTLQPVEEELVPLCIMVMSSVEVKWELIEQWTQQLMTEILCSVTPQQQALLLPYAQKTGQAFYQQRVRLGAKA